MRTAVLAHGMFLSPQTWEEVMWGDPQNWVRGVLPRALQIAAKEGAEIVLFCSGIPPTGGRKSSPHALDFARERAGELLESFDLHKVIVNDAVQNTRDEINWAVEMCRVHEIEKLFLVSISSKLSFLTRFSAVAMLANQAAARTAASRFRGRFVRVV